MLTYDMFYRAKGIRKIQQFLVPRLFSFVNFHFPKNSLLHYITFDDTQGPDPEVFYMKEIMKRLPMDMVLELTSFDGPLLGNPRFIPRSVQNHVRAWFQAHRKFRHIQDAWTVNKDPISLTIVNYSFIHELYVYLKMPMTPYYEWANQWTTLLNKINQVASQSHKNQFLFIDIPEDLPGPTLLKRFEQKITHEGVVKLDSPAKLIVHDIWNWLGDPTKMESFLSKLTEEALSRLNIVFKCGPNCFVINAKLINDWKKLDGKEGGFVAYKRLQKMFLNSLIVLQKAVPEEVNELPPDDEDEVNASPAEKIDELETDDDEDDADESLDNRVELQSKRTQNESKVAKISQSEIDKQENTLHDDIKDALHDADENIKDLDKQQLKEDFEYESRAVVTPESDDQVYSAIMQPVSDNEALQQQLERYNQFGTLTGSQYKNLKNEALKFNTLDNPYGDGKLAEAMKVDPEEITIKPEEIELKGNSTVIDNSMLKSTLVKFDKKYIDQTLSKDILGMVSHMQQYGIIIKDYKIQTEPSIMGDYEMHSISVQPVDGKPSTLYIKMPVIDENGDFMANGIKYRMRKQRGDLPIRKISREAVALTSYYGKLFVSRSSKVANNLSEYLFKQIFERGIQDTDGLIQNVKMDNVFDNLFVAPKIYTSISIKFKSFSIGNYDFIWDHTKREDYAGNHKLSDLEKNGAIVCGIESKSQTPIIVTKDNQFFLSDGKTSSLIGDFYTISEIPEVSAPVEFSTVKVFSKEIPMALVFGYYLGLEKAFKLFNVHPQIVEGAPRGRGAAGTFAVRFKDKTLFFPRENAEAALVFGGLNDYHNVIKNYNYAEFNKTSVYLNLLASKGLSAIYLKELDLLKNLFVDPITKEILVEMKEPLTFLGLLHRANELLTQDTHPDALDMRYMRIKGYERLAGAIFTNMVKTIRDYNLKNIRGQSKLDLNPFAVWKTIMEDPAKILVSDINPIEKLKQAESVTYVGEGGRARAVMNKPSRSYHPTDMGVISEATVDSSDVGINTYLSANPQFKNTRGMVDSFDFKEDGAASLLSTSALSSVAATHDDPKRVNFISIQHSHTVVAKGYRQPYIRTGYETIIPQRLSGSFTFAAAEDGKVVSITPTGMIVEYKNGEKQGITLGRTFGRAEGTYYPHDVVTHLRVGKTFKKNDILAYNSGFFEIDFLNPSSVILKNNMLVKTALYESAQTWEDSSAISERLSKDLTTRVAKVRSVVIDFKQGLKNTVKIGQEVKPLDNLTVIEDEISASAGLYSDESLSMLQKISNKSPKAKVEGRVDRIEIYYNGLLEDMHPDLRALVDASNRRMANEARAVGKKPVTGRVTDDYRVEGNPLTMDTAEIKFFITFENDAGVGDKGVFANQLKSVFGEVMDYEMKTEDGEVIDAVFGQKSIDARIVLSPEIMGTTATLLKVVAKQAVEIYKK